MKLHHVIIESIHALRSSMLRSVLTVVGIVVGIFSVAGMLALGEGLSNNVMARFDSFSQGDISIQGSLTRKDFVWVRELPSVKSATATTTLPSAQVVIGSEEFNPTVQTVIGDFSKLQSFTVTEGEVYDFDDSSLSEPVSIVTDKFDTEVRQKTGKSAVGSRVRINGQSFRVLGVITLPSASFQRGDGALYIPSGAFFGSLTNSSVFSSIAIKLHQPEHYEILSRYIRESLNLSRNLKKDNTDELSFASAQSFIESAKETTAMFRIFLGAIGAIALFVGGIGTMNMMLTTITERTQEIGLRKAIGATNRDILLQILIEAIMLTGIGGVIGILMTFGSSRIINSALAGGSNPLTMIVSLDVVILSGVVSIAVGIVFGLYPAYRASRLQPVEALRKE